MDHVLRRSQKFRLQYRDAVALLAGNDTKVLEVLDAMLGPAIVAAGAVYGPPLLALIGPKNELIKTGQRLISAARTDIRKRPVSERDDIIAAAHTVVVMTSFFEAAASIIAPYADPSEFELSPNEKGHLLTVSAAMAAGRAEGGSSQLVRTTLPVPGVTSLTSLSNTRKELGTFFEAQTSTYVRFIMGLAAWEQVPASRVASLETELISNLPHAAYKVYKTNFRQLAQDVPEFLVYVQLRELERIEDLIERLDESLRASYVALSEPSNATLNLRGLEDFLGQLNRDRTAPARDHVAVRLSAEYRSQLARPLTEVGAFAEGLTVVIPTPNDTYVDPLFREVSNASAQDVSQDLWWSKIGVQSNFRSYFASWLMSSERATGPLVVLGNPGSGKSTLTRVLASQLPPVAYLPVRVELRQVSADASVRAQIDQAISAVTHGDVPTLEAALEATPDQLPVIFLDGLDELIQSAAASRADYLEQVAEMQRQSAAQGNELAVVVTSRTVVADRVRIPPNSHVVRIEAFSAHQIDAWVSRWNRANADYFRKAGVDHFHVPDSRNLREIASQPLLLMMLALFDADAGNAASIRTLRQSDLYEQMLLRFVRREVLKSLPNAETNELNYAVDVEMMRLSTVAIGMFNRSAQLITDDQLLEDVRAMIECGLLPKSVVAEGRHGASIVGRFFFVHEARGEPTGVSARHSYEFLHATFGEFLVARLVTNAIIHVTASHSSTVQLGFRLMSVDDTALFALLSAQPLTQSAQVLRFISDLLRRRPINVRNTFASLVERILLTRESGISIAPCVPPEGKHFIITRLAHYSLNLIVLAAACRDEADLDQFAVSRQWWRRNALTWYAQLDASAWESVEASLALMPSSDRSLDRVCPVFTSSVLSEEGAWQTSGASQLLGVTIDGFDILGSSWVPLSALILSSAVRHDERLNNVDPPDQDQAMPLSSSIRDFSPEALNGIETKIHSVPLLSIASRFAFCMVPEARNAVLSNLVLGEPASTYVSFLFNGVRYGINLIEFSTLFDGPWSGIDSLREFLFYVVLEAACRTDMVEPFLEVLPRVVRSAGFRELGQRALGETAAFAERWAHLRPALGIALLQLWVELPEVLRDRSILEGLLLEISMKSLVSAGGRTVLELALAMEEVGLSAESIPEFDSWLRFLDAVDFYEAVLVEPQLLRRLRAVREGLEYTRWVLASAIPRFLGCDDEQLGRVTVAMARAIYDEAESLVEDQDEPIRTRVAIVLRRWSRLAPGDAAQNLHDAAPRLGDESA